MIREFDFSEEFGKIDESMVENAGKEWTGRKSDVLRLYSRKIAGIAILGMLCIGAAGNAKVQGAVKEFTTKIGEIFGFTKDLSSYTEVLERTQTENGISLTVKELLIDDRVLMIAVHTDCEKGGEVPTVWVNEEKTFINGQNYQSYESVNSNRINIDTLELEPDAVLVQTYEDLILSEGKADIHLVLEAGTEASKSRDKFKNTAEFVYDFSVTAEELEKQTVSQKLDLTMPAAGDKRKALTLKELTMNDLYCRIIAAGVNWDDDWLSEYELKLEGTDSFGNPVSLWEGGFLSENELRFITDFFGEGIVTEDDRFPMFIPDKNCEYLDLQLYERKIIWNDAKEIRDENGEYDTRITDPVWEAYSQEENCGWEPVGEPFRIAITAHP